MKKKKSEIFLSIIVVILSNFLLGSLGLRNGGGEDCVFSINGNSGVECETGSLNETESVVIVDLTLSGCLSVNNNGSLADLLSFDWVDCCEDVSSRLDEDELVLIRGSTSLSRLKISRCPGIIAVKGSAFVRNPKIQYLNLSHNRISDLSPDVFTPLTHLKELDLSGNRFTVFDASALPMSLESFRLNGDSYLARVEFSRNDFSLGKLRHLELRSNPKLYQVCPIFLSNCPMIQTLDLSQTSLVQFPLLGNHFKSLLSVNLNGTRSLKCTCELPHIKTLNKVLSRESLRCRDSRGDSLELSRVEEALNCSRREIRLLKSPKMPLEVEVWNTVTLDCDFENVELISWVTPANKIIRVLKEEETSGCSPVIISGGRPSACTVIETYNDGDLTIFPNGSLRVFNFGWDDRGRYQCFGHNRYSNMSLITNIQLNPSYRDSLYYCSLIYGFSAAAGFLLLTLIIKLTTFLLHNYGCCLCCCCCKDQLPPKAKKLKTALDTIELYRTQQLDRLKENYTQQSDWIRENCAIQMERVRENYNGQIQNLKDIRQYGSSQLQAVRLQYFEQMSRICEYSTSQLNRVHENYIFQRQRLRKFSAQNYLKIRETRKYTQKTLNKVMDNLPALYLDLSNCRQGLAEREDSIVWDSNDIQVLELGQVHQNRLARGGGGGGGESDVIAAVAIIGGDTDSVYFTPLGTPTREVIINRNSASQKASPTKEANPYEAVYQGKKSRFKSKSFSNFLPLWKQEQQQQLLQQQQQPKSSDRSTCSSNANTTKTEAVIEHSSDEHIEVEIEDLSTSEISKSEDSNENKTAPPPPLEKN